MLPIGYARRFSRAALLCATTLGAFNATISYAQTADAPSNAAAPADTAASTVAQDIIVTGYRSSLAKSTEAKRESTGFTDSIFAEDIGKFPDTNIAESFNRIPGITITRDITGEGTNVAIRGSGLELHQRDA